MPYKDQSKNNEYLYLISSPIGYHELCELEMKYIFNEAISNNYYLTNKVVEPSRSAFMRGRVDIMYMGDNLDEIESKMLEDQLHYENYKIHFEKFDPVPYQERLSSMRKLGFAIEGTFAVSNPDINFVLTKIDGVWIFGLYNKNHREYKNRVDKPVNYSNALEVHFAKAIINIAINNNFDLKLIDPCCGVGTVLIEGRAMNVDIKGYEINPLVKINCNHNLKHFGFAPDVLKVNMLETSEHFDVAILDLPYGLFSITTKNKQKELIRKTKEISNKSIIISMEDLSSLITNEGLLITDSCLIKKSNAFKRYVYVCVGESV